ncbi:hypothetical protein KCP70_01470 [Salmonella enterica subsp. enterica]|nr:hypothetical protein KCP70_01470 [Salmonella enterica subsp. enterica]
MSISALRSCCLVPRTQFPGTLDDAEQLGAGWASTSGADAPEFFNSMPMNCRCFLSSMRKKTKLGLLKSLWRYAAELL